MTNVGGGHFRPFRLIFKMQTPTCLGHPYIMGHGLIEFQRWREHLGQQMYLLPGNNPVAVDQTGWPPVLKHTDGVAHASVLFPDIGHDLAQITKIYKRFEENNADLLTAVKKVNLGSGLYRNYMMSLPYLPARTFTMYCCGDMTEAARLMGSVTALGKKTSAGFGAIHSMQVEETDEDYSLIKDGRAMRPLPLKNGYAGEDIAYMTWTTPYWAVKNAASCVTPGAKMLWHNGKNKNN